MPRIRPRRRPLPRVARPGRWFGYGREAESQITGVRYPVSLMREQRGGLVSARPQDQQVDRIEGLHDLNNIAPVQIVPTPLWRLDFATGGNIISLLSLDDTVDVAATNENGFAVGGAWRSSERDTLVALGYVFVLGGFAYPLGTEETGLVPVYRLHDSVTGDYLLTASPSERAATIVAGYDDQGVEFYAFSAAAHNRKPVYRAVAGSYHFYTSDPDEYGTLPVSFTREGVICYVLTGAERTVN